MGDDTAAVEHVVPVVNNAEIDASMVTARAFQRKEKAGPLSIFRKMTKKETSL